MGFLWVVGLAGCAAGPHYFYAGVAPPLTREEVAVIKIRSGWLRTLRVDALDDHLVPGKANVLILSPGKHKLHFATPSGSTQKYIVAEAGKTYLAFAPMQVLLNQSNEVIIQDVTSDQTLHDIEMPKSTQK